MSRPPALQRRLGTADAVLISLAAAGFSAFGVLLYYLVANLAALTRDQEHSRYPRPLQVAGVLGCGALALTVPAVSLVGGVVVLAAGSG